jgi:hypothetical protein
LAIHSYRSHPEDEEVTTLLASIIPKKDKKRIRTVVEENPTLWWAKHHHFLGMNVRNTLRRAGFDFSDITMDNMWPFWVENAIYLSEDRLVLTDSIKRRIDRWKARLKEEEKARKERDRRSRHERKVEEYLTTDLKNPLDFLMLFIFPISFMFAGFVVIIMGTNDPFASRPALIVASSFILPSVVWAVWKYTRWKYISWKYKNSVEKKP